MIDVVAERSRRSWSQSLLAQKAGIHIRTLRRLEKGEAVQPVMMERVMRAFGMEDEARPPVRSPSSEALCRVEMTRTRTEHPRWEELKMFLVLNIVFFLGLLGFRYAAYGEDHLLIAISLCMTTISLLMQSWNSRLVRLREKATLMPDCQVVMEGISKGELTRMTLAQLKKVQKVIGADALVRACHSPAAHLSIDMSGEPA